jgi:hypothetical protein
VAFQLLAASLAAIGIGLSISTWSLYQKLHQPRANVRIIDLVPTEERGYRDMQSDETPLDSSVPSLLLILNLSDLSEHAGYEVELLETGDDRAQPIAITGLERCPDGNFTLEIARGTVPPGEYRITLFGVDDGQRAVLAEYLAKLALDPS